MGRPPPSHRATAAWPCGPLHSQRGEDTHLNEDSEPRGKRCGRPGAELLPQAQASSLSNTGCSQCYSLGAAGSGGPAPSSASGPHRMLTGRGFSIWFLLVGWLFSQTSILKKKSPEVVVSSQVELGTGQQSLGRRAPMWCDGSFTHSTRPGGQQPGPQWWPE